MKKTTQLSLLMTLSTMVLGITTVQAVEVTQGKNKSDATVILEAGDPDTVTPPIEPTVPGGETGNTGVLTIDNLTPFSFDKHKVSGGTEIYSMTATSANIQVTDKRGTGAGWQLKVTASEFKDKTEATKVLKGAQIKIPKGTTKSTESNTSAAPLTNAVTLDAVPAATAAVLFQAEKNQGMGSWVDILDPTEVKLVVPGGNFTGEYTSTLTWVLGDTPAG